MLSCLPMDSASKTGHRYYSISFGKTWAPGALVENSRKELNMAEKDNKSGGSGSLLSNTAKEYLERFVHDSMPKVAGFMAKRFPGLVIDQSWEKAVDFLLPFAEASLRTKFGGTIEKTAIRSFLFELGTDAVRELSQEMRKLGEHVTPVVAEKEGKVVASDIFDDVWMNPIDHPGIAYHYNCPAGHWRIRDTKVQKTKGGDKQEPYEKTAIGFRRVEYKAFLLSGARAPESEEELFVPDTCACRKLFAADKARFHKFETEAAEARQPQPPKKPFFSDAQRQKMADGVAGACNGVGNAFSGALELVEDGVVAIVNVPGKIKDYGAALDVKDKERADKLREKLNRKRAARALQGGTK
jgi:hypothetical protein